MEHISGEQLGSALRRLAADLVEERRRVAQLERENEALRGRIEALERARAEQPDDNVKAPKVA
jgi:cell division protein FtsB